MSAPVISHERGVSLLGSLLPKLEMSMHVVPSSQSTNCASPSPRQKLPRRRTGSRGRGMGFDMAANLTWTQRWSHVEAVTRKADEIAGR